MRRAVVHAASDAYAHLMCGFRQEAPVVREITARDGGCDILWRVAQVDGVYLRLAICAQQTRRKRKDTTAIGCGGLGEDTYNFVGVLVRELLKRYELGWIAWREGGGREGEEYGA